MAVTSRFPVIAQPLAGALLGLCGGLLILLLPKGPGAIAALLLWTAATFAEGERGLARWFTRLPLFGSLIAAVTILIRWYALISLHRPSGRMLASVASCMALGPASAIALGWVSRPADERALERLSPLTTTAALTAMAEAVAITLLLGLGLAIALPLAAYIVIRLVAWFTGWRYGGVRSSDLEAQRIVVETLSLAVTASLLTGG